METEVRWKELAPAKVNLALHVRSRMDDGRHSIETLFAFCTDGDSLEGEPAASFNLEIVGPFAAELSNDESNLVLRAGRLLAAEAGVSRGAALRLTKRLPIASGIGGGSADAAAALRLLTSMWRIDARHASAVAPTLGADVPACLLSMTARGEGAGDTLQLVDGLGIAGTPILLVNPNLPLSTGEVFARWDGIDHGPLVDWRTGRNDLEVGAKELVPQIGDVCDWLTRQQGVQLVRMSGSGATCFALFGTEEALDRAAIACAVEKADWWHLASFLR